MVDSSLPGDEGLMGVSENWPQGRLNSPRNPPNCCSRKVGLAGAIWLHDPVIRTRKVLLDPDRSEGSLNGFASVHQDFQVHLHSAIPIQVHSRTAVHQDSAVLDTHRVVLDHAVYCQQARADAFEQLYA